MHTYFVAYNVPSELINNSGWTPDSTIVHISEEVKGKVGLRMLRQAVYDDIHMERLSMPEFMAPMPIDAVRITNFKYLGVDSEA